MKKISTKTIIKIISEYLMMAMGSAIAAFSIEEFLLPNKILDGGVVGISMIISTLISKIPLSLLTLILNVPFLLAGLKKMGKRFVIKSAFSMAVFSLCLKLFAPIQNATEQYLLAVCFGGVLLGVGVGLVIRFGGCLDGTETVAILLNKKFGLPVGKVILIFNIIIYTAASILFGIDRGMYSLLTYFITSKVIDMVENGLDNAKAAMIITDDADEISDKIYQKLGRTVTIINGTGFISGDKKILYCVITYLEVWELKHIIDTVDSSAFVTISDVSEIIGNHIKSTDIERIEDKTE
ncbi:MAG: YitT family protein [Clostridia bacterium]|nr:YitT family protein [Clostridia bacterium]